MNTFVAASLPRNSSISVCKVRTCKLLPCRVILKLIHESSAIDCLSFDLHYSSTMINLFSLHFWNQNTKLWCVCSSSFIIIVRELRWIWLNSFEFARVKFQTLHVDMPKKNTQVLWKSDNAVLRMTDLDSMREMRSEFKVRVGRNMTTRCFDHDVI